MVQFADRMNLLKGSEIRELLSSPHSPTLFPLPAVCPPPSCSPWSK